MVAFVLNWVICIFIGTITGIILRKKFDISKKVDDIVASILLILVLVVGGFLVEFTKAQLYGIKVHIPSTFYGLTLGWLMSSSFLKTKKSTNR